MSKNITKLDVVIIALFILGAFLAIVSLFLPPMGTISPSVVSVFAMCSILIAVVLAIQAHYTLDIHIGEHRYITWHPSEDKEAQGAAATIAAML